MRKLNNKGSYGFESKEEVFEFLVKESQEQALKEQWRIAFDKLPDTPISLKRKIVSVIKRYGSVAAIFIVFIGVFYWVSIPTDSVERLATKMADETNIIYMSDLTTRGLKNEEVTFFNQELMERISSVMETEDYDEAITLFSRMEEAGNLTTEQKFFYALAISKTENPDAEKGILLLEDVIQKKGRYFVESLWVQSLLFVINGDERKARNTLNKLINTSTYQIQNVKSVLKKLGQ